MRVLIISLVATALLPSVAQAQDKCGQLRMLDNIQMIPHPVSNSTSRLDLVPVRINGVTKEFIFSTTAPFTMMGRSVVDELKLPTRQSFLTMTNLDTKQRTSEQAQAKEIIIGHMRGKDQFIPIVQDTGDYEGIMALAQFESDDVDLDFGNDKLNFFSPDHCPGGVLYWTAPAVAILPITRNGNWITIPVTLDGHEVNAIISSGNSTTYLRMNLAEQIYGLTMGGDDTPVSGNLLNDTSLKTYIHQFKSLSFGSIVIDNPQTYIIPTGGYNNMDRTELVGSRAKTERDLSTVPEMSLGMDVLRQLHLYMAFKEGKLYVSKLSPAAASPAPPPANAPR